MMGKDDLVAAMGLECDIVRHLYEKLPRANWDATLAYRPTPGQRSTLELLKYLSYCGIGPSRACLEGNWDAWKAAVARAEDLHPDEFGAVMDRQKRDIATLLAPLTDQDLATRRAKNPLGKEMPLGHALYDMPVRFLIAYRMQLFLYARALGADVWTPDCWYGITMERPQKAR